MKRTKAIAFLAFAMLFSGALVFASGTKEKSATGAGSAKTMTINVASVYPPGSPADKALQKFKALVSGKSNGRIKVLIHPSGAMGSEKQAFDLLSQGTTQYDAIGTNDISTYYPRYAISEVPYIFSSESDFWKFWNGPGKELDSMIAKQRGVITVGVIYRGARDLTANRPVRTLADLKGLKLRLPAVKSWFKVWQGLGAIPTNVDFSELYTALKTGVVSAEENPPATVLTYKLYEVQKYIMDTEHIYSAARIQVSAKWWNTLSKSDQTLLSDSMNSAVAYANSITKNGDAKVVKELQKLGMTLVHVNKAQFKKAVQPILDEMAKKDWNAAFYAKVEAAISK